MTTNQFLLGKQRSSFEFLAIINCILSCIHPTPSPLLISITWRKSQKA